MVEITKCPTKPAIGYERQYRKDGSPIFSNRELEIRETDKEKALKASKGDENE